MPSGLGLTAALPSLDLLSGNRAPIPDPFLVGKFSSGWPGQGDGQVPWQLEWACWPLAVPAASESTEAGCHLGRGCPGRGRGRARDSDLAAEPARRGKCPGVGPRARPAESEPRARPSRRGPAAFGVSHWHPRRPGGQQATGMTLRLRLRPAACSESRVRFRP